MDLWVSDSSSARKKKVESLREREVLDCGATVEEEAPGGREGRGGGSRGVANAVASASDADQLALLLLRLYFFFQVRGGDIFP